MVGRHTLGLSRNALVRDLPLWGLVVLFVWWDVLNAQAVPVSPEAGTASTKLQVGNRNLPCPPSFWREIAELDLDSFELRLLDIEIQKAEERVSETSFWKRIIPQIHISGSFGVRDVVFIDPTTFTPFVLPRDVYRLTISLPLNEVFNFSKHSLAELELKRLSTERSYRLLKLAQLRNTLEQQSAALQEQLETLQEEMKITKELLRFNQMRFEQGKIEFDTLMRTKLELLSVQKAIQRIQHQKSEVQLKLSQGETQ